MYKSLVIGCLMVLLTSCSKKEEARKIAPNRDALVEACRADMKANKINSEQGAIYCYCLIDASLKKYSPQDLATMMGIEYYKDNPFEQKMKQEIEECKTEAKR